jgi:hypothetical protein
MCPRCGKSDTVLQSVLSQAYECRMELGGCGAEFAEPSHATVADAASLRDAITAMYQAIREFEQREFPMGRDSMLEMRRCADELLDLLKREIGRITTVLQDR